MVLNQCKPSASARGRKLAEITCLEGCRFTWPSAEAFSKKGRTSAVGSAPMAGTVGMASLLDGLCGGSQAAAHEEHRFFGMKISVIAPYNLVSFINNELLVNKLWN